MPSCCKRVPHCLMIAEWHDFLSNDLTSFVALAGNHERVAGFKVGHRTADRLIAVTDLIGAGGTTQNRGPDCAGLFAAGIVVRDDDAVRLSGRNCPHQVPLSV